MDLLTQPETAEQTRLSQRTLERHRLTGTGPKFVRLGRRVLYRHEDVEEWIAANICRSTSEADAMAGRCGETQAANSGDLESRIEETSEGKSRQHQKPDDASHPSTRKSHPLLSRPLPRSQQIRPKIECARMPLASGSRRQLGRALMTEQGRTAPVPQTTPTGKPEQIATSFKPRGNDD